MAACSTLLVRDGNLIIRDGGLLLCEDVAQEPGVSSGAAVGVPFGRLAELDWRKKDVDIAAALFLILAEE